MVLSRFFRRLDSISEWNHANVLNVLETAAEREVERGIVLTRHNTHASLVPEVLSIAVQVANGFDRLVDDWSGIDQIVEWYMQASVSVC